MLDPVMNAWDCAALLPIVRESGGRFSDWTGVARIDGGDAVSTNEALHSAGVGVAARRLTSLNERTDLSAVTQITQILTEHRMLARDLGDPIKQRPRYSGRRATRGEAAAVRHSRKDESLGSSGSHPCDCARLTDRPLRGRCRSASSVQESLESEICGYFAAAQRCYVEIRPIPSTIRRMTSLVGGLFWVLALSSTASQAQAQTVPPVAAAAPAVAVTPLDTFDAAWRVLRDNYVAETASRVDWDALRAELRPRAERATSDDAGAGDRARDARARGPVALCDSAGARGVGHRRQHRASRRRRHARIRRAIAGPGPGRDPRRSTGACLQGRRARRLDAHPRRRRAPSTAPWPPSATRRPTSVGSGPGRWARRCCGGRPASTPTWVFSTPPTSPSRACSCARPSGASPSSSGTCRPCLHGSRTVAWSAPAVPSASSSSTSG